MHIHIHIAGQGRRVAAAGPEGLPGAAPDNCPRHDVMYCLIV